MRSAALLLSVLSLSACSASHGEPVSALEYRWTAEAPWRAFPLEEGPSAARLSLRFTVPPLACVDPAVFVVGCTFLERATIAGRDVEGAVADCFVPLRADEVGRALELGFSEHQRKAPVVLAGCQAALRQSRAEDEGGPLFITVMLLGTGLLLLGLIRGLAARLRHPNLVPVVDVGLTPGGPMYLVMELVEGPTLDASRKKFGDEAFGLRMLTDVTRALVAMHGAGIIHRDLKPANVLLSNGAARLADFGIARADTEDSSPEGLEKTARPDALLLTRTGAVMGTPQYMSPEVAVGQPATRASDVFALGLMGFELLTGRYPLVEPAFLAVRAGRRLVRSVPDEALPERVRQVLSAALSEDPAARPTASEVEKALG